jgi:hypothetical protein
VPAVRAEHEKLEQQLLEGEAILKSVREEMEQAQEKHSAALAEAESKLETAEADAAALREELISKTMVSGGGAAVWDRSVNVSAVPLPLSSDLTSTMSILRPRRSYGRELQSWKRLVSKFQGLEDCSAPPSLDDSGLSCLKLLCL